MQLSTNDQTRVLEAYVQECGETLSGTDSVRKPRKVDVAYEELRRMIVTLELEPGSPIDERYLVDQLGIGRTPVREAIQRLIHEGMITHTPRRGSWVSPLSFSELQYLIESRRMLEMECCRLAAQRMSANHLRSVREKVEETGPQIKGGDSSTSVFIDQYFHGEIARATGNRFLMRMMDQLQHELIRYWYVSSVQVGELHIVVNHHLEMLEAIESGNPDEAERAAEYHVTLFRQRLGAFVGATSLVGTHDD